MPTEQRPLGGNGGARARSEGRIPEDLAADTHNAGEKTLSHARNQAETARNRAADGMDHATDTARSAAERLQEQEPWLADLVSRGADELAHLAETLRANDLHSMLSRAEELSRRQPMLVAGAAFAAGFAAMRAIRSGAAPAAAGLSDVVDDARATARRETGHVMEGARQTTKEVSGHQHGQHHPGIRNDTGAEIGRTGLGC